MVTSAIESKTATPETPAADPTEPKSVKVRWSYRNDGKRDLRIDLLRGFAVFAMVVDHIGGPSWLYALTGGNRFFVSAAEGFVFISGLMVGLVYGTRIRLSGLRTVLPTLLQRAWTLYLLAVWLALSTALIATVFALPEAQALHMDPARFAWEIVSLQRTSYLVDVMLLYAFLMLLSPLALLILQRRGWLPVAAFSLATWTAYQFVPERMELPWPIADNVVFKLASWQILFFAGLLLGFDRYRLGSALRARLPSWLRRSWQLPIVLLFGLMIWLHVTDGAALGLVTARDPAGLLDTWFDKSALPPARLAASAVVFALAWAIVSQFWHPIARATGWLLLPLGQAALYAYAAHLFLVVATDLLTARFRPDGPVNPGSVLHPAANAGLQFGAVMLLLMLTRARFLARTVESLGQPPLVRVTRTSGSRWSWRPSDTLVLILVIALAAAPLRLAEPEDPALERAQRANLAADPKTSANSPRVRPESTVTAPRKIAGAALGSTDAMQRAAAVPPSDATIPLDSQTTPEIAIQPQAEQQPLSPSAALIGAANTNDGMDPYDAASTESQMSAGYLLDGEFFSRALDRTMPYGIYLPPGYDFGTRRYPVLYMLHGSGGHYSEWVGYGLMERAEELIASGQIAPMIIVLPQGDGSFWINQPGPNGQRWGDYVAQDLVQHIDTTFRTIATSQGRAIGGLSMGGFGALSLGFTQRETFGTIGAHSPSLRTWADAPDILGNEQEYAAIDPVSLVATLNRRTQPRIWLDVGRSDGWAGRVWAFHERMQELKIAHRFQERKGEHDSDYWAKQIPQYLQFYASMIAAA